MNEKKTKILIVEDEDMVREVLKRILEKAGDHDVVQATDGQQGLDKAVEEMPDLIITDIRMPGRDGLWLLRSLRLRRVFDPIPILVVSSMAEMEDVREGFKAGASDYITKPFVAEELLARVGAHLRSKLLFDQLNREREELKIVHDLMLEMTQTLHLGDLLYKVTQRLAEIVAAERCSVILTSPTRNMGWVLASHADPRIRSLEVSLEKYPEIQRAITTRQVVIVGSGVHPDLDAQLASVFVEQGIGGILVVPLIAQGSVLGVIASRLRVEATAVTEDAVRKARLVAFAASGAIRNAHMFEEATAKRVHKPGKVRADSPEIPMECC